MRDNCDRVQLLVSKYVDNEAAARERREVESHVARCRECALKLARYLEVFSIVSESAHAVPAPTDPLGRTLQRMGRPGRRGLVH